jgi:hypothetical protein
MEWGQVDHRQGLAERGSLWSPSVLGKETDQVETRISRQQLLAFEKAARKLGRPRSRSCAFRSVTDTVCFLLLLPMRANFQHVLLSIDLPEYLATLHGVENDQHSACVLGADRQDTTIASWMRGISGRVGFAIQDGFKPQHSLARTDFTAVTL